MSNRKEFNIIYYNKLIKMVLSMSIKIDKAEFGLFLKTGIVVLSFMAILFSSIKHIPAAVTVTSHTNSTKVPIHSVETNEKVIALTFDLDSEPENLVNILETLDKYNVKATFFITGKFVENYPEELNQIVELGHDLGNHSTGHKHMDLLTAKECGEEILNLHKQVKAKTGIDMTLFRPPYGDFNNTIIHTATELGYETIKWDINSHDWKDYSSKEIIRQTTKNSNLKNGSIILFHTTTKYTVESLEPIIINLQEQGYKILPVSELIYTRDYTVDSTGRQYSK